MDAITLLKDDHKTVKQMFRRFDKLKDVEDHEELGALCREFCAELQAHAAIEELIFYPAARRAIGEDDIILEAGEEHHVVDVLIEELGGMEPSDEHYAAKATVLIEMVKHHIEEEETEMFPKVREALGRKALVEIGEQMQTTKDEMRSRIMAGSR